MTATVALLVLLVVPCDSLSSPYGWSGTRLLDAGGGMSTDGWVGYYRFICLEGSLGRAEPYARLGFSVALFEHYAQGEFVSDAETTLPVYLNYVLFLKTRTLWAHPAWVEEDLWVPYPTITVHWDPNTDVSVPAVVYMGRLFAGGSAWAGNPCNYRAPRDQTGCEFQMGFGDRWYFNSGVELTWFILFPKEYGYTSIPVGLRAGTIVRKETDHSPVEVSSYIAATLAWGVMTLE
jgi:hypothetical protein